MRRTVENLDDEAMADLQEAFSLFDKNGYAALLWLSLCQPPFGFPRPPPPAAPAVTAPLCWYIARGPCTLRVQATSFGSAS